MSPKYGMESMMAFEASFCETICSLLLLCEGCMRDAIFLNGFVPTSGLGHRVRELQYLL